MAIAGRNDQATGGQPSPKNPHKTIAASISSMNTSPIVLPIRLCGCGAPHREHRVA